MIRVVRHKQGWAVEKVYGGSIRGKTVLGVYRTKKEAESFARDQERQSDG